MLCEKHQVEYETFCQPCSLEEFQTLFGEELAGDRQALDPVFRLDTEEKVEWALRKLANWKTEKERIQKAADERIGQIDKLITNFERRFGLDIQEFTAKAIEGGKKKSLKLFNGVLGFRKSPATIKVNDKDTLLKWAKRFMPHAIQQTESVQAHMVQDHWKTTGEVADGMEFTPETEKFYIRIKGDE